MCKYTTFQQKGERRITASKDKMNKSNHDKELLRQPDSRKNTHKKKKHTKKKKNIFLIILKKLFACIATTLLSLFLIIVITGTIVATALTIYVMDFMDESSTITLAELESGSNTYLYGTEIDENGEAQPVVLREFKTDVQRIPVSIDRIPQHVRNAFVYTEDERFYVHDGVDYKRTFTAFLNMFLHFYDTDQGGSTITQQLIKNITKDDEKTPQRKIREIFSAMQLEKTYSKDEILEEYLNYIGFGGSRNGIQLASIDYFGKTVEDLTVPEAAVLAAIPKSPQFYGPFVEYYDEDDNLTVDGKANNKERKEYVLWQMYKNGAVTYDEYQEYLNTEILYTDSDEYKKLHPEVDLQSLKNEEEAYTWEVDAMLYEACDYLQEIYNIESFNEALNRIYKGGYKIYSTVDKNMQNYVEEKFLDLNNIISKGWVEKLTDLNGDGELDDEEKYPHVAFIAMRYDGSVMAQVGTWGPKTGSLVTNYAVREPRQIGSTIKPISTYGLGIESDHIHWGSRYRNSPLDHIRDEQGNPWPFNYGRARGLGEEYKIYYFLQKSFNTVPAQLCDELTPAAVFKFCTENLGMKLDDADEAHSPLSIGSLTYGITLENLVNAYLPYGAKGVYNEAHIISKIEDANGQVIVDNTEGRNTRQAVSDETAWVMNRLIKNVVENGTGTDAKLYNKTVVGKTGTTEDWYDLAFVGMTRDFASGITIGYKEKREGMELPSNIHSAAVWNTIIGEYANTRFPDTGVDFDQVDSVIQAPICEASGMIAREYCPKGVIGYWKSSNAPYCDGNHYVAPNPSQQTATTPAVDPNGGGSADPNGGGGSADPNGGGGSADPNGGGGSADPNGGGGSADPNGGGGSSDPNGGGGSSDPNGGGGSSDPNGGAGTW